ncbi:MAG: methyltransferase domain-containing protein [Betaproteobacteria bacterium]|nr:MAG: methyltransferase domain-containing protein [Betaproteobacteria bacterium]TMH06814.1 MAG: methyltransferase domain-containing protein [Betaproteobacteria bacterium]
MRSNHLHVLLIAATLGALLGARGALSEVVLHTEKSLYRNVTVTEQDGERCMKFSRFYQGSRQSCIFLNDRSKLVFAYTKMMLASLYLTPNPKRVLVIGLGGGTLPGALQRLYPDIDMDVVEVDAAVIRVAQKYFDFRPGPNVHVIEEDGRVFVKRAGRSGTKYDLVLLDAFDHEYIPEHMLTREFLQEVKAVMQPDGVLAANTFSNSRLYAHESATYEAVFGRFYNLKDANRVILVKLDGLPSQGIVTSNASSVDNRLAVTGTTAEWLLPMFSSARDWPAGTRVLTDQYSPANLLNVQ